MSLANTILVTDPQWNDSGSMQVMPIRTFFIQTQVTTLSNSVITTNLDGNNSAGNPCTISGGFFSAIGRTLTLEAWGTIATTLAPSLIVKVQFAGVVLASTGSQTLPTITGVNNWHAKFAMTLTSTGSSAGGNCGGLFTFTSGINTFNALDLVDQAATFSSPISQRVQVLAQFGAASPSNVVIGKQLIGTIYGF